MRRAVVSVADVNTAAMTTSPTTTGPTAARRPAPTLRAGGVLRVGVVLAASVLLGGLTSWAQGVLPQQAAPFANSASGWAVLTVALVVLSRTGGWRAAALGAASFVLLVLGYTAASHLRGLAYSPVLWGTVGLVTGPFVGLAAAWLRTTGRTAALGTAAVAGILVGDGVFGLTHVADTTGVTYWVTIGVAGVALLVGMAVRRLRECGTVLLATVGTLAAAAALVVVLPRVAG